MSAPVQEWTTEDVIAGLRRWTETHDAHVRAAVELLIEHGSWVRRADFLRAAVDDRAGVLIIGWRAAAEFLGAGVWVIASSTDLAILQLAIDLGSNRYRLTNMGAANAASIIRAITTAVAR